MSIVDETGTPVATYEYDPYGNIVTTTGTLAEVNPLRYRGYYYDSESGFYYLQSRYYDPEVGRFLNADAFISTGQGILGNNMFAFCGNNPINMADPSGHIHVPAENMYDEIYKLINRILDVFRQNYEHNSKIDSNPDTTTKNRIINDQNGVTGESFKYGKYMASWNACETIAIHNARVLRGMDSSLSDVMLACQLSLGMIGDGYFGTNPYAIGNVLERYGIEYTNVNLSDMAQEGIYIISYWNPGIPFNGLHTVAVSFDGTTYTTYNYSGYGELYYGNPADYARFYICGYYLGG